MSTVIEYNDMAFFVDDVLYVLKKSTKTLITKEETFSLHICVRPDIRLSRTWKDEESRNQAFDQIVALMGSKP